MPGVRLRTGLVKNIDGPRRRFQTRRRGLGAVEKGAERKRHAGDHLMVFSSQEGDSLRNMIEACGTVPQCGSLAFEGFSYFRRASSEQMCETGSKRALF